MDMDLPVPDQLKKRAASIRLLLMDVDGVLTDGTMYYLPGPSGQMVETKGFNSHDGLGLHFCRDAGLPTGVISGLNSPAVAERARILGMSYVYQGHLAKEASFDEILLKAGVVADQVAFIGDDFTDVPLLKRAGLAVAVANARPEVKSVAHMITAACGGKGAVREVIELILKAQGHWQAILQKYRMA